jgi:hypothetical protein
VKVFDALWYLVAFAIASEYVAFILYHKERQHSKNKHNEKLIVNAMCPKCGGYFKEVTYMSFEFYKLHLILECGHTLTYRVNLETKLPGVEER